MGFWSKVVIEECGEMSRYGRYKEVRINKDLWVIGVWDEIDREIKIGIEIFFLSNKEGMRDFFNFRYI